MRAFLMLSAVVLAAIGIGVGIESGSHPAGLFGTGQHAFIAGFPEQPSLTTYVNPDWGFGGFEPGVFSGFQLWGAGAPSSVTVGRFRRTAKEALADLRKTAKLWHSVVTFDGGIASTRFVWHNPNNPELPPWTIGVVEVRGTDVFYALGDGDSYAAANLTPSSFRLPDGRQPEAVPAQG